MKLELKHIAPYLPYGLKSTIEHPVYNNGIHLIESIRTKSDYPIGLITDTGEKYGAMLSEIKPILRPLSEFGDSDDTRKVHEFIGLGKWCDNYDDYFNTWFNDLGNIDKLILQAPQEIFNYFLANHFDVFGLIEKRLAIDINSLTELSGSFNSH